MINTILLGMGMIIGSPSEGEVTLNANVKETSIIWKGAKVTGQHTGTIQLTAGSLVIKHNQLIGGEFVIDMTTIENTDLTGEYKGKLENHLKSDDFFGVATYPTANLKITEVIPQGPGKYKVLGHLTIKNITKEVKFPVTMSDDNKTYTANIVIDRSEFDVRYGSGSFFDDLGDKVIYDEFEINVNMVASK